MEEDAEAVVVTTCCCSTVVVANAGNGNMNDACENGANMTVSPKRVEATTERRNVADADEKEA